MIPFLVVLALVALGFGFGWIARGVAYRRVLYRRAVPCAMCEGKGKLNGYTCAVCEGLGAVREGTGGLPIGEQGRP